MVKFTTIILLSLRRSWMIKKSMKKERKRYVEQ